jgi:hypothetical protein
MFPRNVGSFPRTVQHYKHFLEDITLHNRRYEGLKFYNLFTKGTVIFSTASPHGFTQNSPSCAMCFGTKWLKTETSVVVLSVQNQMRLHCPTQ